MSQRTLPDRIKDFVNWRVPQWVHIKSAPSRLDRPVASFTFDDFPKSAAHQGAAVLERHGLYGTYYAAGSLCGCTEDGIVYFDRDDLASLHARGHEIGDHSYSHWHQTYRRSPDLIADIERNAAFIETIIPGHPATAYAFPYGETSVRTKRLMAGRYATCRGGNEGVNAGRIDLAQLNIVSLERPIGDGAAVRDRITEAVKRTGWIIFMTHDVQDDPSIFGITPAQLERVITDCQAAGLDILPMRNAVSRVVFGAG